MSSSGLKFVNKIEFDAGPGIVKSIELFYGDITLVPPEDKVDLLMISAFHGDYSPTPTSLIGALHRKFNLLVGKLAKDKEEDLRKHFYCWWSKPLPADLPYRRILCFESSRSGLTPQKSIQSIFKALVPACSLFDEGVVMSPLLSTGNQGYSEKQMLQCIIEAAHTWMTNGLNINKFKLVLYRGGDELTDVFSRLKKKLNKLPGSEYRFKAIRAPVFQYDFYLSFVSADRDSVEHVKNLLYQHKNDIKFYTPAKGNDEMSEEQVFSKMKICSRVITFLSPLFVDDDDCMDEYNAAWCLNRQSNSSTRLAPMLCDAISTLPTYMSLIQWVDIRIRDGSTDRMIKNITLYMVGYIQEVGGDVVNAGTVIKSRPKKVKEIEDSKSKPESSKSNGTEGKSKYDIFLSYAHANEAHCKSAVQSLEQAVPGIRLFIDRAELRTGGSWQQKLYNALESSEMVIALLSDDYLKSKMCNEEFRLSLARHFTEEGFQLIPIQVENISEHIDDRYTSIRNTSLPPSTNITSYIESQLVPAVSKYISTGQADGNLIQLNKKEYYLSMLLEEGRCARLPSIIATEPERPDNLSHFKVEILSSAESFDIKLAQDIRYKLEFEMGLRVRLSHEEKDTALVLSQLDEADIIVALISPDFLCDGDLIESLQVAINRQRYDDKTRLYPVLLNEMLSSAGSEFYRRYCDLLTYECSLSDSVWTTITIDEVMGSSSNYECIMNDVTQVQEVYELRRASSDGLHDDPKVRAEKDQKIKHLKFVGTVCNRIVHHLTEPEMTDNQVLVDVFVFIKEIVLEREEEEKKRGAVLDSIRQNYALKPLTAGQGQTTQVAGVGNIDKDKTIAEGRKGVKFTDTSGGADNMQSSEDKQSSDDKNLKAKENIEHMKSKYSPKDTNKSTSQACTLL